MSHYAIVSKKLQLALELRDLQTEGRFRIKLKQHDKGWYWRAERHDDRTERWHKVADGNAEQVRTAIDAAEGALDAAQGVWGRADAGKRLSAAYP